MLLLAPVAVFAQESQTDTIKRPKFTTAQAELIIPRPRLQPVKSMIPTDAGAIDTVTGATQIGWFAPEAK